MSTDQNIRDFSLKLITLLVWFEILWAVVFVIGLVLDWTFISEDFSKAYYGSGIAAAIVLAVVTLLNVATNLNIISKAHVASRLEKEDKRDVAPQVRAFPRSFLVAAGLIVVIVFSLWLAEWRLYKNKASEILNNLQSIAESKLATEAIDLIKNDVSLSELKNTREAMAESIQSGGRLSFIIPEQVKGVTVYRELTAWTYNKDPEVKISKAGLRKFIPKNVEVVKFNKLKSGELEYFSIPSGKNLRAFWKAKHGDQEIILLLDTSRRLKQSYRSYK